jgi:hypothetical protein
MESNLTSTGASFRTAPEEQTSAPTTSRKNVFALLPAPQAEPSSSQRTESQHAPVSSSQASQFSSQATTVGDDSDLFELTLGPFHQQILDLIDVLEHRLDRGVHIDDMAREIIARGGDEDSVDATAAM